MTYRDKTPVLCFYEYVGRWRERTTRHRDAVMVEVEFSDQIPDAFDKAMRKKWEIWSPFNHVGPRPLEWKLLSYQTPNGKAHF